MDYLTKASYWNATSASSESRYPSQSGDSEADVVIVGAGITGLTAGLHLKRAGKRVIILEAGRVGAGTTSGTSGHLDTLPDQGAGKLIADFGEHTAQIVTRARMEAITQIERWCAEFDINCEFARVPAFFYSESSQPKEWLDQQFDAVQRLGLPATWIDEPALPFASPGAVRIDNQGRFHAQRYVQALAKAFHGDGCMLYEHSRAQPPQDGDRCTVETENGIVTADDVLLCTHSAFYGVSNVDMRIAPYNSYMLAVRVAGEIPDALYWDDQQPYHYIRRASSDDPGLLLVGGADHKTGEANSESDHAQELRDYVAKRFQVLNIEHEWSSEFFEPADGLPFVGKFPTSEHIHFAGGFSGTGLTFGTMAGKLLAEQCTNVDNAELADLFALTRVRPFAAAKKMVKENLDAAWQFVADRLKPETVSSLDDIPPGSGRLVSYRNKTLAVYRDKEGTAHALSPQCTHAGCIVHWNDVESTWDCPCHGGRFSCVGERIYGPPAHDLERESLSAE